MLRRHIAASILCLASVLQCTAQSSEPKSEINHPREINVTPLKDLLGQILEMCNSAQTNTEQRSFSVLEAFEVNEDGSIPRSGIKMLKSSGSNDVDRAAVELLQRLGETHALAALSSAPSKTLEIKLADDTSHIAFAIPATTPEEARTKADQLRLLLGLIKFAQKAKGPALADLMDHLVVKADDKRINVELVVPCSRAADMLRLLKHQNH
jgi:hypothetical protein